MGRNLWVTLWVMAATVGAAVPARAQARLVVVVAPFANNTGNPSMDVLRLGLADMLATDLAASGQVMVVERERLSDVAGELKLQQSSAFDPATAQKVGRFVGATHVVLGSVAAVDPKVRLDVRLHTVDTNASVAAATVSGDKDKLLDLQADLVERLLKSMGRGSYAAHARDDGRWARAPDLDSAVAYGQALSLLDEGRLKEANDSLAALMKKRPTFGLARVTRDRVEERIRASRAMAQGGRAEVMAALRNRARDWLATAAPVANDTEVNAARTLGYRWLEVVLLAWALEQQVTVHPRYHRALVRRVDHARVGAAVKALGAAMETLAADMDVANARQRRYVAQFQPKGTDVERTLQGVTFPVDCPKEEARVCEVLGVRAAPTVSLVRRFRWQLLLLGRVWGFQLVKDFTVAPPPAAMGVVDAAVLEAELRAEITRLDHVGTTSPTGATEAWTMRTLLGAWLLTQGRRDDVGTLYQQQLDEHPAMTNDLRLQVETQLRDVAGITRPTGVEAAVARYQRGWAACEDMDVRVGLGHVVDRTASQQGPEAVEALAVQLLKACAAAPRTQSYVHTSLALWWAEQGDCDAFRRHMDGFVATGGSPRDRAGYERNYAAHCQAQPDAGVDTP